MSEALSSSLPVEGKAETAGASGAVSIIVRDDVAVTHIAARRGVRAALDGRARASFGVDLPSKPQAIEAADAVIVWAGPEQWLIIEPRSAGADASAKLASLLSGLAAVVDVSDSRGLVRISGAAAASVLAKGVPIDLHERIFKPGDAAITHFDHLGIVIWRLPQGEGFEIACARTYSEFFLDGLLRAASP